MADYPSNIPILPIVGSNNYPRSGMLNARNREIEAACTEVGVNPTAIDDTIVPTSSPASFTAFEGMLANILKTIAGTTTWVAAAVPMRRIIGMHGNSGQVGAGSTVFAGTGWYGLTTPETKAEGLIPYHLNLTHLYVYCGAVAAQPVTGSLVLTLRKNEADTSMVITIAAGSTNNVFSSTGAVEYYPGDSIALKAVNNAGTNSMDIQGVTMEVDQKG